MEGNPKPGICYLNVDGLGVFALGETWFLVGNAARTSVDIPLGANNPLQGIDLFAYVCHHESVHYKHMLDRWNNNKAAWEATRGKDGPDDDKDSDLIPNRLEDTNLNKMFDCDVDAPPAGDFPGPGDVDTDQNGILHNEDWDWTSKLTQDPQPPTGITSDEEWITFFQARNATGDHSKDWAYPGMQHRTLGTYDD